MSRAIQPLRVGARVRALRHDAGLTQAQVAETVGIAAETMPRIERGRLSPSSALIARLAAAIGVAPSALFEQGKVVVPAPTLRSVDRKLLTLVKALPEPLVEDVIRGVRLLLDAGRQAPATRSR